MSLLWRDRLGIALFPDRLVLARTSGMLRRRLEHKEIIAFHPAAQGVRLWQPAVEALAAQRAAGAMADADVTLVLSNRFVRYALVPHSEALSTKEEEIAFARHSFTRVHGAETEGWTLKLSDANPGRPRLACAVERELVDALNTVMAPLDARYRSLQPHLMASFNRWRAALGQCRGWFVVVEPGLLSLSLLRDGHWESVRTIKVGDDWPKELPGVLTREECLAESQAACDDVFLFAPDGPDPLILQTGKWRFKTLLPTLLPGMAAGVDAPFSIALPV